MFAKVAAGGQRCFQIDERQRIWIHRGETRRNGYVAWCDMPSTRFLLAPKPFNPSGGTRKSRRSSTGSSSIEAKLAELKVAVAGDCFVKHAHVESEDYRRLRKRAKYRSMGLHKHGFHSMRYPGGGIVRA